jgi:hypothetical protein
MDVIYTERRDTGYTIGRKQTRYSIFVDAAGPYDEYNIHLAFGYQELGWNVYASNQEVFYQLNSIYAGISIAYQLLPGLKITFGGLIPIINWITYKNVKGYIPKNPLFYDFTVGFIWSGNFWGRGQ